jgi:Uma2 family endonuclease
MTVSDPTRVEGSKEFGLLPPVAITHKSRGMNSSVTLGPLPHRFTRDEYHCMGEAGLFLEERVELLNGKIMTMSPKNSPHAATVHRLWSLLSRLFGATFHIRVQDPIILGDWSEPEPDIAVCQPDPHDYAREHPRADQVIFVIEVAGSSLSYDRNRKAPVYAASNIPVYWIVNLRDRRVEVRTDPDAAAKRYRSQQLASEGDELSLPGGYTVAVADILPPI